MKSKHREEEVYAAVKAGWFEIRKDGSVWRIALRRANRWNPSVRIVPCEPHRIDASCGAGYRTVKVKVGLGRRQASCCAHRLIWLHFNGPIPGELTINHKNGNKADNRPENLELATHSEQILHAYRTGLKSEYGEKNPAAKLSDLRVEGIRAAYASGRMTQASLAIECGVKHQTISKIVRGDRRPRQSGPTADYVKNRNRGTRSRDSGTGRFRSLLLGARVGLSSGR